MHNTINTEHNERLMLWCVCHFTGTVDLLKKLSYEDEVGNGRPRGVTDAEGRCTDRPIDREVTPPTERIDKAYKLTSQSSVTKQAEELFGGKYLKVLVVKEIFHDMLNQRIKVSESETKILHIQTLLTI